MTDTPKASDGIADWALLEAYKRISTFPHHMPIERIRASYDAEDVAEGRAVYALARMIEKHEKPPEMPAAELAKLALASAILCKGDCWLKKDAAEKYAEKIIEGLDAFGFQVLLKEVKP